MAVVPALLLLAHADSASASASKARTTPNQMGHQPVDPPTVDALIQLRVIEESFQETIGVRSWREQQRASFDLHLDALDARLDRGWRHPRTDRAEAVLADNALKFLRKRAESYVGIDALEQSWREKRADPPRSTVADGQPRCSLCERPSLRLSPRLDVGDSPYLGVKMRVRGVSPILSRFTLRIDERLDEGLRTALSYDWRETWIQLEYRSDDHHHGELLELQLRLAF